jgi:tetratricopeptide (TPR) repeat protein
VATNPRIDDLRRRLDREPQSRLFAQLAEELRKEGDLREAIQVARRGLEKHPNYPSARMTLGRALFDSREFGAARSEFESVVKGAPDNILASRLLAECLEALGDVPGAIERYKATLVFSPGDKQVMQRLDGLEKKAKAPAPAAPAEPGTAAGSARATRPPTLTADDAPIPLVEADEEFELERPFEPAAPSRSWQPSSSVRLEPEVEPEKPAPPPAAEPPAAERMMEFELEVPPPPAPPPAPVEVAPPPPAAPAPAAPAPARAPAPPAADAGDLTSPTLAELYFNQGALDKAADAYRRLLEREPGNERFRARLAEIERLERHLRADEVPAFVRPADPAAERRQRLEGTVARLEGLLAAIKRGVKA